MNKFLPLLLCALLMPELALAANSSAFNLDASSGIMTLGQVAVGSSTLSVNGGVGIGTTYAGSNAAASNNLIVQGSVGIGTTSPTNILSLGGTAARTIWMERATAAGNSLTIQAGGAVSGGTDLNGGTLILQPGVSVGTGTGNVQIKAYGAGSTGTADNSLTTVAAVCGGGVAFGTANCPGTGYVDIDITAAGVASNLTLRNLQAAANNNGGRIEWRVNNSSASAVLTAAIDGLIPTDTAASEQGAIDFRTINAGSSLAFDARIQGTAMAIGTNSVSSGQFTLSNASAHAGQATCWTTGGAIGYCTTTVGAGGACTCTGL